MTISMLIAGLIIAFVKSWVLSLTLFAVLLIIPIGGIIFSIGQGFRLGKTTEIMDHAGGLAEQSIRSIKTVKQMNGEEFETKNFTTITR